MVAAAGKSAQDLAVFTGCSATVCEKPQQVPKSWFRLRGLAPESGEDIHDKCFLALYGFTARLTATRDACPNCGIARAKKCHHCMHVERYIDGVCEWMGRFCERGCLAQMPRKMKGIERARQAQKRIEAEQRASDKVERRHRRGLGTIPGISFAFEE